MSKEVPLDLGSEQFAKCFLRPPFPAALAKRCGICIDESNQYLCHDPASNRAKTITSCTGVSFTENVVPERSLALPVCGCEANLLRSERGNSHVTGHGFAGREPNTLAALQVSHGERMIVLDLTLTGNGNWQLNQCLDQLPVNFL